MKNFEYKYVITDNKVIALSSFAGHTVRGVAKCHPQDTFDVELGKQLAAARCGKKIAEKRYKRAQKRYHEICDLIRSVDYDFHEACDYLTSAYERLAMAKKLEESVNEKIYK